MTAVLTVLFAALCVMLWREAVVAHRECDDDNAGVFLAVGSLFAYGALVVSGIGGL